MWWTIGERLTKKGEKKMALFGNKKTLEKVIADFEALSDEDKEKFKTHITESKTEEKVDDEPAVEEETETETEDEVVDETPEAEATEEEVEDKATDEAVEETAEDVAEDATEDEGAETEEVAETAEDEVEAKVDEEAEAWKAKFDALESEFNTYKEKVDKLFERLEENDEPSKEVGLARQDTVGDEEDDEELSAYEYAKRHAKY